MSWTIYEKKVDGLQVVIEDQELEIESKGQEYSKLFIVKENLRHQLEEMKEARKHLTIRESMK